MGWHFVSSATQPYLELSQTPPRIMVLRGGGQNVNNLTKQILLNKLFFTVIKI